MARFVLHVSFDSEQAHAEEVMAMRENRQQWMELCAQAANEQDSQKLMELIKQITALLDAKQERLIEKDSQRSFPNPSD
jgi:hypothetical protein